MNRVIVWLSAFFIRLLTATLRMEISDQAGIVNIRERGPCIFAFWHNRLLLLPILYQNHCPGHRAIALISRSRDGQIISDVAAQFGIEAARGSSTRHGLAAALKAIHALKQEKMDICVTPDGPRGPRYEVHPGIFQLAHVTGQPIVPLTIHFSWKIELKSWDKFQVPLPFSRCHLVLEPLIHIPTEAQASDWPKFGAELKETLQKSAKTGE